MSGYNCTLTPVIVPTTYHIMKSIKQKLTRKPFAAAQKEEAA
ncbi:MAG: hypothetical protein ACE3JN_12430 [Ectobacillus sp.]